MDDPSLEATRHRQALRGIARMNRAAGSPGFIWQTIRSMTTDPDPDADGPLRVLDLACGAGDNVIEMSQLARQDSVEVEFHGCDLSPTAIQHAKETATHRDVPVRFFRLDLLREAIPHDFDVLTNTLFLHHLDKDQAVGFLRAAAEASPRLVLSDLVRSRRGLVIAGLATRILSGSAVVHADGPQSVRAAFTTDELSDLAQQAGLTDFHVQGHFPQRMCLTWQRQPEANIDDL